MRFCIPILLLIAGVAACSGPEDRLSVYLQRGESSFADREFEKARVEFANALQIDPDNIDARIWSGKTAAELEQWRVAVRHYEGVRERDAANIDARLGLARIYAVSDQVALAETIVDEVLAIDADNQDARAIRGVARIRAGETGAGEFDLRRVLEQEPSNETAATALASLLARSGSFAEAIAVLRTALGADPSFTDASLLIAEILRVAGRLEDAAGEIERLVQDEPDRLQYRVALARLYQAADRPERIEQVLRAAVADFPQRVAPQTMLIEFLAQTSVEGALSELAGFRNSDAAFVELRFLDARLERERGNAVRAEAAYRDIAADFENDSNGLRALTSLAQLKINSNDFEAAAALVAEVLERNPGDTDALVLRSSVAMARAEPGAAIVDLRTVLRSRPDDAQLYGLLAEAHAANGELAVAREELQRAVDLDAQNPSRYMSLARFESEQGNVAAAQQVLKDALTISPQDPAANHLLFRLHLRQKDWDAAAAQAGHMREVLADAAVGEFYAGLVQQQQGDLDGSEISYRNAIEINPRAIEPLSALVSLLLRANRGADAEALLAEHLAAHSDFAFGWNLRGEVALNGQGYELAERYFEQASELAPQWWLPYRGIVWSQLRRNDTEGAYSSYQRGVQASGSRQEFVNDFGLAFEQQGRPDLAIEMHEALLEEQPSSLPVANGLAVLLATHASGMNDVQRALALAEPLAQGGRADYLDTYGWTLLKNGRIEAAKEALEQANQSAASLPTLNYHMAMLEAELGNSARALELLDRALEAELPFVGAEQARAERAKLVATL